MSSFNYIRPVGETVLLKPGAPLEAYESFQTYYLQSGTQALQCALEVAKSKHTGAEPEAIIPAYACPDLVSACMGAGVKPVLVDLDENSPFPSPQNIEKLVGKQTIAVILVNFLGISPPQELFDYLSKENLLSIEDRAQAFVAPDERKTLKGDLVVFSFGKGKPVSLLGGGALLVSKEAHASPNLISSTNDCDLSFSYKAKVLAYNLVIQAFAYGWLLKLPGLNIGSTEYKSPIAPEALSASKLALLNHNIQKQHSQNLEVERSLHTLVGQHGYVPLAKIQKGCRLLRLPFLMPDKASRDLALEALNKNGIGASSMYNAALADISGVPLAADQMNQSFENARNFADRLMTLPCHSGVSQQTIERIETILLNCVKPHSSD